MLEEKGCKLILCQNKNGHVDLNFLMDALGKQNIDSIILEGGSELNWSALESGIVQKVQAYIAPKLFGGKNAKTAVGGLGFDCPSKSIILEKSTVKQIGNDFLIESRVKKCSQD